MSMAVFDRNLVDGCQPFFGASGAPHFIGLVLYGTTKLYGVISKHHTLDILQTKTTNVF
jgi:hypothetical protein